MAIAIASWKAAEAPSVSPIRLAGSDTRRSVPKTSATARSSVRAEPRDTTTDDEGELLIFITPRIVRDGGTVK